MDTSQRQARICTQSAALCVLVVTQRHDKDPSEADKAVSASECITRTCHSSEADSGHISECSKDPHSNVHFVLLTLSAGRQGHISECRQGSALESAVICSC